MFWAIILAAIWAILWGPGNDVELAGSSFTKLLGAIAGGGLVAWAERHDAAIVEDD